MCYVNFGGAETRHHLNSPIEIIFFFSFAELMECTIILLAILHSFVYEEYRICRSTVIIHIRTHIVYVVIKHLAKVMAKRKLRLLTSRSLDNDGDDAQAVMAIECG